VRRRALLIGRNDYWPGYTVEVIKQLDFDFWPELALACDRITEQREAENKELERLKAQRSRGR